MDMENTSIPVFRLESLWYHKHHDLLVTDGNIGVFLLSITIVSIGFQLLNRTDIFFG